MATKATPPSTIHTTQAEYLRLSELVKYIPLSSASIWRKAKSGEFPSPTKLSAGITAWKTSEVKAWLESKAAA